MPNCVFNMFQSRSVYIVDLVIGGLIPDKISAALIFVITLLSKIGKDLQLTFVRSHHSCPTKRIWTDSVWKNDWR